MCSMWGVAVEVAWTHKYHSLQVGVITKPSRVYAVPPPMGLGTELQIAGLAALFTELLLAAVGLPLCRYSAESCAVCPSLSIFVSRVSGYFYLCFIKDSTVFTFLNQTCCF